MTDPDLLAAAAFLDRLRAAGYRRLGGGLPDFDPAREIEKNKRNLEAAQPGGLLERDLVAGGIPPALAAAQVAQMRAAFEQDERHRMHLPQVHSSLLPASPYVDPKFTLILARLRKDIDGLAIAGDPGLPGKLHSLLGRLIIDVLPTGEMNARAFRMPKGSMYAICFDPTFFDFINLASQAVGSSIETQAALEQAMRYAQGDPSAHVRKAIRWDDIEPLKLFHMTVLSYIIKGWPPPVALPFREQSFQLIETLRWSCTLFVMAHECAHILLDHLSDEPTLETSWEQELEADHLGWRMVDEILSRQQMPEGIRVLGAQFFFACCAVVELARYAVQSGERRSMLDVIPDTTHEGLASSVLDLRHQFAEKPGAFSHPPLSLRLTHLNLMISRGFSEPRWREARFLSIVIFEVVGQFWGRMENSFLTKHAEKAELFPVWGGYEGFLAEQALEKNEPMG